MKIVNSTGTNHCIVLLTLLFTLIGNSNHASASERNKVIWQGDLGLAAQIRDGLIAGLEDGDEEIGAALLVSGGVYYGNFFVEAAPFGQNPLTVGYVVAKSAKYQMSLIGQSSFPDISESAQQKGNLLDGLHDRHASFEAGFEYYQQSESGDIRLRVLHDTLGNHSGHLFFADYSYPIFTRHFLVLPAVGISYFSAQTTDYYFGIEPQEATTDRPEYHPSASWTLSARVYTERPLSKNWSLFGFASYSLLDESIANSPIVTAEHGTYNLAVGVLWSF